MAPLTKILGLLHLTLFITGIIVITDGNVGIADVGRYDNLLVQLLSQSCTCSVIEVQCSDNEKRGFGRIPHSELLEFIATATFGAYFNKTRDMVSILFSCVRIDVV